MYKIDQVNYDHGNILFTISENNETLTLFSSAFTREVI